MPGANPDLGLHEVETAVGLAAADIRILPIPSMDVVPKTLESISTKVKSNFVLR
jgi:hypothetical protein